MQLPFVQNSCTSNPPPCTDPISIVRKPQPGESATSVLGSSRLYNKAQIRILLADTVADLHPERGLGALDADDVQFVPGTGYPIPAVAGLRTTAGAAINGNEFYGLAKVVPATNNWVAPLGYAGWTSYPLLGELTTPGIPNNGQGAWLRVEYMDAAGAWHGITRDWLGWSFSRQYNVAPNGPGADPYNPNAILMLQQMNPGATSAIGNQNAFYPINFYDAREGEMRDAANGCAVNGIMNAVEINVGNLARWLSGQAPYTQANDAGLLVNYTNQNGYVLYFSDHRGMLRDPNPSNGGNTPANVISGESGLEDVVNSGQNLASTSPDGVLEPTTYYTYSPEDADQNARLDNWGAANIGNGFGVNTAAPLNPYRTTACSTIGLSNAVSGARHVLKLVGGWNECRCELSAAASGQRAGWVYGGIGESGLRSGQLQQRTFGPDVGRRKQYDATLRGRDHCRHGHRALQQLERCEQPGEPHEPRRTPGNHVVLPHGSGGRKECSVPAARMGSQRLWNGRRVAQLPPLPGELGRAATVLQRLAGEHVLLRVQHGNLQVLHGGLQSADA